MAVTKKTKVILSLLPLFTGMVLAFQNCSVELSENTYGAASSCEPTEDDLAAFETLLTNFFQNTSTLTSGTTACGYCHLSTSGNPAAATFGIQPGTTTADKTTNWCSVSGKVDRFQSNFLTGGGHPGGVYSASDVQAITDWAATLE